MGRGCIRIWNANQIKPLNVTDQLHRSCRSGKPEGDKLRQGISKYLLAEGLIAAKLLKEKEYG
jgi:hypothetical protein